MGQSHSSRSRTKSLTVRQEIRESAALANPSLLFLQYTYRLLCIYKNTIVIQFFLSYIRIILFNFCFTNINKIYFIKQLNIIV